jgi:hypothetical protein
MLFLKNYGVQKAKDLSNLIAEAIVKFDPEGATEAAIAEIEEKFDKLNLSFSKAKQAWEKENAESVAITTLYNQRLAAAEILQEKPEKAEALAKLVSMLEDMLPDVQREQQEALDAKQYMDDLEALVTQYAEKLKIARETIETAKRQLAQAELNKQRANEKAEAAKVASGLSSSGTSLSSAITHMENLAQQAATEADAASRKASLLQPTQEEDDADIQEAMAQAKGDQQNVGNTIQDRLAALRKLG